MKRGAIAARNFHCARACSRVESTNERPARPAGRSTKHFHTTKHPIIESFEPDENWGWCYVHEEFVDLPRELLVAKARD